MLVYHKLRLKISECLDEDVLDLGKELDHMYACLEDAAWRLSILRGLDGINGFNYLFALSTPLDNLAMILLRISPNPGGADRQSLFRETATFNNVQEIQDEHVWYLDRMDFVTSLIPYVTKLEALVWPKDTSSFVYSLDLLFSSLRDHLFKCGQSKNYDSVDKCIDIIREMLLTSLDVLSETGERISNDERYIRQFYLNLLETYSKIFRTYYSSSFVLSILLLFYNVRIMIL